MYVLFLLERLSHDEVPFLPLYSKNFVYTTKLKRKGGEKTSSSYFSREKTNKRLQIFVTFYGLGTRLNYNK